MNLLVQNKPDIFVPFSEKKRDFVIAGKIFPDSIYSSDYQNMSLIHADAAFFKIQGIKVHLHRSFFYTLVTGIEIVYINILNSSILIGATHFSTLSTTDSGEVKLDPSEFVVSVSGNFRNHLHRVVFHTNKNKHYEFGKNEKNTFDTQSKANHHLTAMRVGINKGIQFLIFERYPYQHQMNLKKSPIVLLPTTFKKVYNCLTKKVPRKSDFQYFDSFGICTLRTKVISATVQSDGTGITSIQFVYMDSNSKIFYGQVMGGTGNGKTKLNLNLENNDYLSEVHVYGHSNIIGLNFKSSNGKNFPVGYTKGRCFVMKGTIGEHLTSFEISSEKYLKSITAYLTRKEFFEVIDVEKSNFLMNEGFENIIHESKVEDFGWDYPELPTKSEIQFSFYMDARVLKKSHTIGQKSTDKSIYFDDVKKFNDLCLTLLEVIVYYDYRGPCGINLNYKKEDGTIVSGGSGISMAMGDIQFQKLSLEPNECIIEFSGCYKETMLTLIKIATTKGKVLEIGVPEGYPFLNLIPESSSLVGLGGFLSNYIEAVLVYHTQINIFV